MTMRNSRFDKGKNYHSGAVIRKDDGSYEEIVEVDFKCIGHDENGNARFDMKIEKV